MVSCSDETPFGVSFDSESDSVGATEPLESWPVVPTREGSQEREGI